MQKLHKIFFVFTFILISSYSYGFNDGDSLDTKYKYSPLRIGVNAGIGMGSMRYPQGNVHFFNHYIETFGSYALTPRTGLLMGIGYNQANFNGSSFNNEDNVQSLSSNQYFISAGGYHHVNDRLTLTGMAQFSVPVNRTMGAMANPFGNTRNFDFNAHYKVTDNFSIGAGIRYSEGNFGNGFGNSLMYPMMPFGNPYGTPLLGPSRR